jgi:hypothetical protein
VVFAVTWLDVEVPVMATIPAPKAANIIIVTIRPISTFPLFCPSKEAWRLGGWEVGRLEGRECRKKKLINTDATIKRPNKITVER